MTKQKSGKFHWTFGDAPLFKRSLLSAVSAAVKSSLVRREKVFDSVNKPPQNYPFWIIEQEIAAILHNSGFAVRSFPHKVLKYSMLKFISLGSEEPITELYPETAKIMNVDVFYLQACVSEAVAKAAEHNLLREICRHLPAFSYSKSTTACDIVSVIGCWFVQKLKRFDYKFQ